jgi:hypothetical protein
MGTLPSDFSRAETKDDFSFLGMGFSMAPVFAFALGFAWSGWGRVFNGRNGDDWNAISPAHIDCGANEVGAGGILKHCHILNFAGEAAEVSQLFNGQLQCIALVNKNGGAIENKLNGGAVANHECGQRRAGTLTFIYLAFAAAFARVLFVAMRVRRTGGTRLTQAAGRNKRGLVLAINRDQGIWHFLSSRGDRAWWWAIDLAGISSFAETSGLEIGESGIVVGFIAAVIPAGLLSGTNFMKRKRPLCESGAEQNKSAASTALRTSSDCSIGSERKSLPEITTVGTKQSDINTWD